MESLLKSIPDTARALGIGRTSTYGLIARGELETVTINRRRLVVADSIREYVDRLTAATPVDAPTANTELVADAAGDHATTDATGADRTDDADAHATSPGLVA